MLGVAIAVLIIAWAIYGLQVLDPDEPAIKVLAVWFAEPGNNVRAMVAVASLLVALIALFSKQESFLGQFKGEMLSIAITVVVIDELSSYRSRLERKQEIIDQLESPVRDAAVEAVRLARKLGFLDEALRKADLRGVNLEGANLERVHPERINLSSAHLEGANLNFANLMEAELTGAHLDRAELIGACLERAYLFQACFEGACLDGANLKGARLVLVNLQDAILEFANLKGANLKSANFEGAGLSDAHLENADLMEANLKGVYLKGAYLNGASLTSAIYDKNTVWPEGFDPIAAGAILAD